MNHGDLVALIRDGVEKGGRWADLGAGEGAFTFALGELLGPGSHVTAVDRDARVMRHIVSGMAVRYPGVTVDVRAADFRGPLGLHDLDGVVMANSLHFVRERAGLLRSVKAMLRPGGRLVVVEYGTDHGNPWVPHPFTYEKWVEMAGDAGFTGTRLLTTIPSRHLGSMYSALSLRPDADLQGRL